MLRSFENAIAGLLNAEIISYPKKTVPAAILNPMQHGMNRAKYRYLLPKTTFNPEADVLWVILMGPENLELDLYKGWQKSAKKKVIYIYDTLPMQMDTIKRLFSNDDFDVCITSFEEAIPALEKVTKRKWYTLAQAAPPELFRSLPIEERLIHFSNYGRRLPLFHNALIEFCRSNNLYYDYTTHDAKHPVADPSELYKQYAWHLNHSLFNVCWPVELTNPQRAGYLRPITGRWFEAGLSGCIIIGKAPDNPSFNTQLDKDMVEYIDPFESKEKIFKRLDQLWENREALLAKQNRIREANKDKWSWESRVNQILEKL